MEDSKTLMYSSIFFSIKLFFLVKYIFVWILESSNLKFQKKGFNGNISSYTFPHQQIYYPIYTKRDFAKSNSTSILGITRILLCAKAVTTPTRGITIDNTLGSDLRNQG